MNSTYLDRLKQAERLYAAAEKWVIIALVAFLGGFALLQIVLRNFFSTGIIWGDTLLRHLMLWVSFFGAARATSENRHIRIEILPMVLPASAGYVLRLICNFLPLVVCIVLTYASFDFVGNERISPVRAFAGIPTWWLETIFPFSFAVMALRFGIHLLEDLSNGPTGRDS